jgi:hypothetical protein
MKRRIPCRYRNVLFALVMSGSSALIVSGIIIYLHIAPQASFIKAWMSAFAMAWPVVFLAILVVAPLVNRVLDVIVEPVD